MPLDLYAAFIPSPSDGVWNLGPVPLRGYALSIIVGIILSIWVAERRWVARGGTFGDVQDLAIWMVPFGLVGGRLYHVITDYHLYFGEDRNPVTALYVWRGGLGIWGAVALGALGAAIGARRKHIKLLPMLDTLAPAVLIGQALGRWGNWFNQELFGRPTDAPWALEIDAAHRPPGYLDFATFHPTFLYEFIWNLAAFAVVVWADRRFRLGHGRVVALYVMAYTAGRGWIEYLRIDTVQMNDVFGLRLNVWTSIVLFVLALAYFVWATRNRPGREEVVYTDGRPVAGSERAEQADEPAEAGGDVAADRSDLTSVEPEPGPRAGGDAPSPTPEARPEER
ncbi:prolipoprotein diacylglyceryl transferase [Nocardioides sp. LHG3406-4]|uniref:prolipoprotein diacylglyceryl transferase n=1 Tax=Nocardioides sp. LHG3406-4 TaxID=2804575 RepID=UPI003CF942A1